MTGVLGFALEPYQAVRDVVEATQAPFGRGGGAICVYVDGRPVVDLWGGLAGPNQPWTEGTAACLASVTKAWAAVVVHQLVERGILDLTTPLCEWWPEFAAHGKAGVTLTHVLLHSTGVLGFVGQERLLHGEGWSDYDAIAAGLASAEPRWTPGTRHGYHAVSYGWLLNEVVRRASGSTIGELFARDVAKPLELDARLGIGQAELDVLARALPADLSGLTRARRRLHERLAQAGRDPQRLAGIAFLADGEQNVVDRAPELMSHPGFMSAEVPASNGISTARAQARLFAALAAGGSLDGTTVLQPQTVERMRAVQVRARDEVMASALPSWLRPLVPPVPWTLGLGANRRVQRTWALGPNPRAYGAAGHGGQVVMADPDARVSVASICTDFTPTLVHLFPRVVQAALGSAQATRSSGAP